MFRIIKVIPAALVIAVTVFAVWKANAESPGELKASPTPAVKRQDQSIVHTTKSNPKDVRAIGTPTPTATAKPKDQAKGWDGKVQGKQLKNKTPSATPTPTPQKSR